MNHHVIKAKDFTDFYGEVLIATNHSPFENKTITMKVQPLSGKQEFIVHDIKGNTFDVVYSLLDAIEKYNDIKPDRPRSQIPCSEKHSSVV